MAQQQPAIPLAAVETRERPLLGEQTAGSLIRNVWRVYRSHFVPIVLTYFLPTFPLVLLGQIVRGSSQALELVALFAYMVSGFVASGALTVTLSDVCLGTVPTVRRSYARVLRDRTWLKLFTTGLLAGVLTWLGLVLLLLPGIWVMIRSMFCSTIVVLEGRSGRKAIRRSFELTRGQFWRLLGLLALIFLMAMSVIIVVSIVGVMAGGALLEVLANLLVLGVVMPTISIAMVLLYYDQRVRRESYDAQALFEDLMR